MNQDISSKFWGNLEGIWEILGKYRILDGISVGSKGLKTKLIIPEKIKVWPSESRERGYMDIKIRDGR